jgi:hypothetical protein
MHHPLFASRLVSGLAGILFCLVFVGCASDAAMEKRIKSMQEEVDRVQSRADRLEERLTALEVGRQKQTVHVDEEGSVSVRGRPELKVVKVSPDADAAQAKQSRPAESEVRDDGPRPVIRATGTGEGRIDNLDPAVNDAPEPQKSRPNRDSKAEEGSE